MPRESAKFNKDELKLMIIGLDRIKGSRTENEQRYIEKAMSKIENKLDEGIWIEELGERIKQGLGKARAEQRSWMPGDPLPEKQEGYSQKILCEDRAKRTKKGTRKS